MLKSEIYDFVICRGGTDMCFVLRFGWKRPDLKQYRISGLTHFAPSERLSSVLSSSDTCFGLSSTTAFLMRVVVFF